MEQTHTAFEDTPLWSILARATELLDSDPHEVIIQASAALKAAPGQPQALQLLIFAMRALGDDAGARRTLEEMAAQLPQLASVHLELGLLLAELGDNEGAVRALTQVIALEPQHPQASRALADALALVGDTEGAAKAYSQQFASSIKDLKMLELVSALGMDQIDVAGNMLREFLSIHRTDLTALQMLAKVYVRVNQFEAAEETLSHALEIDPSFDAARRDKVAALRQQMKSDEELRELDILLENDPENREYRYHKGAALSAAGKLQEAVQYCELLLKDEPGQPRLWVAYAYALRILGQQDRCVTAFREAIKLDPDLGEAWWGLANLKTVRFAPEDIETMRKALERTGASGDEPMYLNFALGKAMEDAGAYEQSFRYYKEANAIVRAQNDYDRDEIAEAIHREKRRFTQEFFATIAGKGSPSPDPIFILGMPRSGSTLVEQILASHSAVEGGGELPYVTALARRLNQNEPSSSEWIDGKEPPPFAGEDLRALGEEYLQMAKKHRKLGRPFFTDKAPNNFRHLGLICAMLPNAKIIDVRRHPLACCFANFRQIFPSKLGPSYDLNDMGHHYRGYVSLLAHFDRVLPGRIHRVIYEELIQDTENEVRRLLDYCGLSFEVACLNFHKTERSIQTVSSEQVRRPIYRDSLEQWRHFDAWLGPLKSSLGSVLDTYPAVPDEVSSS